MLKRISLMLLAMMLILSVTAEVVTSIADANKPQIIPQANDALTAKPAPKNDRWSIDVPIFATDYIEVGPRLLTYGLGNGNVIAVAEKGDGSTLHTLSIRKSTDAGATFLESTEHSFNQTPILYSPQIANTGGGKFGVVACKEMNANDRDITFYEFECEGTGFPNGISWSSGYDVKTPTIASWDNIVYLFWWEQISTEMWGLGLKKRTSGVWGSTTTFDTVSIMSATPSISAVAAANGLVLVAWNTIAGDNNVIYVSKSTDYGSSFTRTQPSSPVEDSRYPEIAVNGNQAFVVWEKWVSGSRDICGVKSTDTATSWSPRMMLASTSGDERFPSIAMDPDGTGMMVVYLNISTNKIISKLTTNITMGSDWETNSEINDWNIPVSTAYKPAVAFVKGYGFIVAWGQLNSGTGYDIISDRHTYNSIVTITPSSNQVSADAGSFEINVLSNTAWSVINTADWINVSQTNGNFNSVVTVNYAANNTPNHRETVIDVFGGEQADHICTIVQAPMNTANDDSSIVQPLTALKGNFPNPFNPHTTISYSIKEPCMVDMNIYNIKGNLVKNLLQKQSAQGDFTITWDGTDNSGNKVSSGIYYLRMNADKYQSYKKMMLMK